MPGFELFGEEECKEVNDVLATGVLMRYNFDAARKGHWKAKTLEETIQKKFQIKHVQLTSSGTTALITALNTLRIGTGDEVIIPTFTFVASFEALLTVGAIPILADINNSLTLDPQAVEKKISPRTKAIMPVHMCGGMADLDLLIALCKKHDLYLLEDACQAIGATYKGKYLGTIGDIGCLSFDYVKTITCGEGGAVLTHDENLYRKADHYSDHGHDHQGHDRGAENHPFIGLNFRISELHAAVGLAQFRKLGRILEIQRKNKQLIKEKLTSISGVSFRHLPDPNGDNASFLSIFLPSETQARKLYTTSKIEQLGGVVYWYDNHWHYLRNWDHLKKLKTLAPLHQEVKDILLRHAQEHHAASDEIMSRTLTFNISLWDEIQAETQAKKIHDLVKKKL
ncbi:MAG: DegT/DnrJ/EryC1/StrS family aminotransferase [Flavobacteriales bacterium AspAUS03]